MRKCEIDVLERKEEKEGRIDRNEAQGWKDKSLTFSKIRKLQKTNIGSALEKMNLYLV